ncbi:hypothetical protein D3C87_1585640 [compost metagenome]
MPPADKEQFFGTPEGEHINKILSDWIQSIPDDVEKSYGRVKMTDKRNVRQQAGMAAKVCGQVQSGDVVYVDPRPEKVITKDGYQWKRIYLVPAHSRLFKETCAAPEDGVYYIAL